MEDLDRELVLLCQQSAGDAYEAAFAELYRRHKDTVYAIAYRVCGDRAEALDAAQETFLILYKKLRSFQFESKFTSWLYRLVVNATIDHLRRTKKHRAGAFFSLERLGGDPSIRPDEALGLEEESYDQPDQRAERTENRDRVLDAIAKISPKLRIVTVLRYQQQLSYDEIAETLEVSIGTVKSRLSRAHLALAELLRREDPEPEQ